MSEQFRFYDNKGLASLFDLPSLRSGSVLADSFNALSSSALSNAIAQSDRWNETPFGVQIRPPDPPGSPPPWQVYGSNTAAKIKVSNFGDLWIGPNADDTLTVEEDATQGGSFGRMAPETCNDPNSVAVIAEDLIFIEVTVTPTTLVAASATLKKVNSDTGWTDYPALCSFNGSNQQTELRIPLAHVKNVSKNPAGYPSVDYKGDFTLLPGCLGLFQLLSGHIFIELSTYLGYAALLPNPFPGAIK